MLAHLKDACDFQVVEYWEKNMSSDRNHEEIPEHDHDILSPEHVNLSWGSQKCDGRHEAGQKRQRHRHELKLLPLHVHVYLVTHIGKEVR